MAAVRVIWMAAEMFPIHFGVMVLLIFAAGFALGTRW